MMNKYTIMRSYYDVVETHSITIYICSLTSATSHQQKYEHGCLFFSCNTYTVQSKPDNHKTLYNATHDVLEQNSDLVRGLTLISALALLRVSIKNHVVCQQLGTNQGEFFRSPKGGLLVELDGVVIRISGSLFDHTSCWVVLCYVVL